MVYDLGADKGRTFIVMELLDGRTLKDLIAARSLSVADAVNLTCPPPSTALAGRRAV